jgi:hypothetical protein
MADRSLNGIAEKRGHLAESWGCWRSSGPSLSPSPSGRRSSLRFSNPTAPAFSIRCTRPSAGAIPASRSNRVVESLRRALSSLQSDPPSASNRLACSGPLSIGGDRDFQERGARGQSREASRKQFRLQTRSGRGGVPVQPKGIQWISRRGNGDEPLVRTAIPARRAK